MRQSLYRQSPQVRSLVRQVPLLGLHQMLQPLFLKQGATEKAPVPGLKGVFQETSTSLLQQIEQDIEQGVKNFLLFGIPAQKHKSAFDVDFLSQSIQAIRKNFGNAMFLAVDVCLCSFTQTGHCGVLMPDMRYGVSIDQVRTVEHLAALALQYAQAGADAVAPSDMMDHRVKGIRTLLDQHGLGNTLIMSYSAKFHSKFYGPFREAAESSPQEGLKDRATYQIDPAHPRDAYLSSLRDAQDGADILMVKPGLYYLDVLAYCSKKIQKPWAVYEVSGEYASVDALAEKGLIDGPSAHIEAWTAFQRAGAQIIISYGSRYAKKFLEGVK